MRRLLLGLFFFAAILFPVHAADPLVIDKDITFGKGSDVDLKLDLYRQQTHVESDESIQPAIVVIFGGGFRAGNKEMMRIFCEQYARAGFVVVAPSYRLLPNFRFPAPVEDVKCAVRWIRAHASEYRIDTDNIGAMGMSAGAHLSMMLGYMDPDDGMQGEGGHAEFSSKVQAVVNYAGAFDLTQLDWDPKKDSKVVDFMGKKLQEDEPLYWRASPAAYVDEGDAPTLCIHGTRDPVVPYGQAVLAHAALLKAGVPTELKLVRGASHGWWGKDLQETQQLAIEFFTKHLKNKAGVATR